MHDETTMRVFKKDAIVMKQLQSLLELHNRRMTQAELIHFMFEFLTNYQDEFLKEAERQRKINNKIMEEWTKFALKRMREL